MKTNPKLPLILLLSVLLCVHLWPNAQGVAQPARMLLNSPAVASNTNAWQTLVTGQTLASSLRNDFTGPVGFAFVCQSNCTCRALGRWVVSGNSQTHVIALCDSNTCTVLAYATVNTSGATPGAYTFASLATPYAMTAGNTYLLLSQELSGGDQWYDNGATGPFNFITFTGLAAAVNSSYGTGSLPSSLSCVPAVGLYTNEAYVPVNMQYTVP